MRSINGKPIHDRSLRAICVLGIAFVGLILRGDGCITEDRSVEGVITVGIEVPWHTQGYTETGDSGNLGEHADEIIDALGDVSTTEIRAALDAGAEVTIAGALGRVTANAGHDAARTVHVTVALPTLKIGEPILDMAIPNNQTGTEVSASDDEVDRYLHLQGAGIDLLAGALTEFLELYLDGNDPAARSVLESVSWEAEWTSDPDPTAQDPDDFHWEAELIINIPVLFEVTTPNI